MRIAALLALSLDNTLALCLNMLGGCEHLRLAFGSTCVNEVFVWCLFIFREVILFHLNHRNILLLNAPQLHVFFFLGILF